MESLIGRRAKSVIFGAKSIRIKRSRKKAIFRLDRKLAMSIAKQQLLNGVDHLLYLSPVIGQNLLRAGGCHCMTRTCVVPQDISRYFCGK